MISLLLPTFNEMRSGYLAPILQNLVAASDAEVIVIDGGSQDGTVEEVEKQPVQLLHAPNSTRAGRLNIGIEEAAGDVILLHHPRSLVETAALDRLSASLRGKEACWGGFSHCFDNPHALLRFTSWYSNRIRFDRQGIVYLDHCIFFHSSLKNRSVRIPDVEIFEDTELSLILRRHSHPLRAEDYAQTSAVRFTSNGIYKQAIMNQYLKLAYWLKASPSRMNKLYEKGLDLNK